MKAEKGKAGFTFIEMITVLVIAGIMTAIALPLLKGVFSGNKLKITAQHIQNTLALARTEAISRRKIVRTMFDTTYNYYWIETDDGSETVGLEKIYIAIITPISPP